MSLLRYSSGILIGLLGLFGMIHGGWWCFTFPALTFGFIPLCELFMQGDESNLDTESMEERQQASSYQYLLYAVVPLQYTFVVCYLWQMNQGAYTWLEWLGSTLSLGVACGTYGINVAHELGHRPNEISRFSSKALLLTSLYMHFFIEHNRGHHAKVATPEDPASARLGENVYAFWVRSVYGSFMSAWHLEKKRLARRKVSPWTFKNQMLRFLLIEIVFLLTIFYCTHIWVWLSFILAACLGFLLLETVNYIEHYGLQRTPRAKGRYEPVLPIHSWNSNHSLGRSVLFELSRHSDHHAHPKRSYATLRHHDHSLQLPTGYPGMIIFSLFPMFFIPYMDKYITKEHHRVNNLSLTS